MSVPIEYNERIIAAMDGLTERLASAEGFVLDQAPLVLREALWVERATTTLTMLAGVAVMVAAVLYLKSMFRWLSKPDLDFFDDPSSPPRVILGIFAFAASVVSSVALIEAFRPLATAWLAPRVYMIEWVADQIGRLS